MAERMGAQEIVTIIDKAMRPHFEVYAREAIQKELDTSLYTWVEGAVRQVVNRMIDDQLRQEVQRRLMEGFDVDVRVIAKVTDEEND